MIKEFEFSSSDEMENAMSRLCYFHEHNKEGRKRYIGYNFPTGVCFLLDTLSKSEERIKRESKGFQYVVGYLRGDVKTRDHELRHAEYFLSTSLQKEVKSIWNDLQIKIRKEIEDQFRRLGYSESVWIDEFHAYLTDLSFWSKRVGRYLQENYCKYFQIENGSKDVNCKNKCRRSRYSR